MTTDAIIVFALDVVAACLAIFLFLFVRWMGKIMGRLEAIKQAQSKTNEDSRLVCPDCGSEPMEPIQDYSYDRPEREEKVEGNVYHCSHCGHDEVVEKRWQLVSVTQRRYFHG